MRWFHQMVCVVGGLGLILFLASAQPKLNIAPQGGEIAISWSATNSTNDILQQTLAPWNSNLWINVSQPPSSNNGAYYVLLSPTNNASFFRLFLAVSNLVDVPDDAFIDSNGDGIDGDVARAIFVATSGNDGSPGTMAQPLRTMAEGIQRATAANKDVYVATGVYASATLNLANRVSIYGGYSAVDWSRSDANISQFNASAAVAIAANNLTNSTTLDHLTITSANATNFAESSYGILGSYSPGLIIRRCTVQSGNGGSGLSGSGGIAGTNGGNGVMGQSGCEDSNSLFCDSCPQPQGGAGATNGCNLGGKGGDAGHGSAGGSPGLAGGGGTLGGPGAPGESQNGTAGGTGTNGMNGTEGLAAGGGNHGASGFAASVGGSGSDGNSGNGGGGGGGGGGGTTDCDSYGSSGGGGGGGGCGGTGGTGGQSGGGSFAIYLFASNARIEFCTVVTGNGGKGGDGGNGGVGGIHGVGGSGGPYGGSSEQDDGGNGAPGGDGGDGGRGGHGGGGAGGPSIAVLRANGSSPQLMSLSFTLGSGGVGGSSSGNAGSHGMVSNVYP
jgi:hypothetical protein